ncbi:ATP-binding protein [Desulfuromonas acetexigens]|uniref:histidine kinase n=1 Tax=Trichloromonas acetexigens TaxID=38815 RepID=A0A550JBG9_9BACT|nr:ATP-binding protein [Desulfuromonas acetexigens]TRO80595.1 HAMP domain-containing protein [Desulfuromonas acetexigens]
MRGRPLIWFLYPSYLILILVVLLAVAWYTSRALRDFHVEQTLAELQARGRLISERLDEPWSPEAGARLDALSKELGRLSATRITVILPDGRVLGDSQKDPARMDNHGTRAEVAAALGGREGHVIRYSATLGQEMMYAALPQIRGDRLVGALRVAIPVTAMSHALQGLYWRLAGVGLGIAAISALLSLIVSRRIARPLEEMTLGAERFARGDLGQRLPVTGSLEIAALGSALNRMAAELDERIQARARQNNEMEAVLSSMSEGVIAVDPEERILRINQAAARLLAVTPAQATGRRVLEVARKAELQRFVARVLASHEMEEEDLCLPGPDGERSLQMRGAPLRDLGGREIGALMVFNDVTRLRRLESVRRDFVANVSHELKTPITAIKGSVETLLGGGALGEPAAAERFLAIVARQASRLEAIVDDLLALSRIEQDAGAATIPLVPAPVWPVLHAAQQVCQPAADEKQLEIRLFCSSELRGRINAPLLEQALVNLLTNAVKYSSNGGKVVVDAAQLGDQLMIKVQDWGVGIAAEHLPRVFERFYRVDPARSRKLGGTGLGLAIVKHIAQAHGGQVVVHSTPGEGSVFTLILPAASA